MITALLQQDTASGETWLSFARSPAQPIRDQLKSSGWRYHGGHRAWRHGAAAPPFPEGVALAYGGDTQLSTIAPRNGPEILEVLARAKAVLARSAVPSHA